MFCSRLMLGKNCLFSENLLIYLNNDPKIQAQFVLVVTCLGGRFEININNHKGDLSEKLPKPNMVNHTKSTNTLDLN